MNNQWNKIIYKVWSPIYDKFFNVGKFNRAREIMFDDEVFEEGKKVLFVGVGTGADLDFVDISSLNITAIDFSPDMLKKAKEKFDQTDSIIFLEMDAQNLQFPDESFDIIVASLILSVVPDAERCMEEMIRVTKKNGEILIFDKFAPKDKKLNIGKQLLKHVVALLGTDISLSYERIMKPFQQQLFEEINIPLFFKGMYRKIKLRKI